MKKIKLLSVLLFSSVILTACGDSNPFDELADEINGLFGSEGTDNKEEEEPVDNKDKADTDTETDNGTDSDTSENSEEAEKIDYSHLMNKGEAVTLDEGVHDVGKDIEPGRYKVTAESGYGSIYITDDEDRGVLGETIDGKDEPGEENVTQFNVFLDEGYIVEIDYVESMNFEPYKTENVDTIYPGQWVAGEDFDAGVYDVSLPETEETGTLEVTAHPDYNKSRHTLGSELYGGMTEFTMSFEEGDIVSLKYLPEVTLTER
ncbi:hypothetical protein GCM10007275_14600 [Jeotgalicoccus coquinae]|uniref:Uncharacterized protein YheU (UPF0270 family) n=1 Tax=Jeotgalicoccus coquinae TaxID=709509 RepID=A0A6V7R2E8_9STAP|nr:hypothetical protein [Jeotgalicoccus coquinae]MBB6423537.1 uncharacterized protein YheU (UPF0270 family) [Jeotgalicoccus coquinae]GGE20626.1 hypothetical protein GCM10007275_14600 [Jeotgalicoccus coquinae]CAD2071501.1 hypothetical protein JEOCOQ751_00271 [Jeotgalicoccus coquinae]